MGKYAAEYLLQAPMGGVTLTVETDLPDGGQVTVTILEAEAPNPLRLTFHPARPEDRFTPLPGARRELALKGDPCHTYRAYLDIHDEPFDVYPIVDQPL